MHPCPAGCCGPGPCASREVAVENILKAGDGIFFNVNVEVPALNKWTKMMPVIQKLGCCTGGYNLLGRALISRKRKKLAGAEDPAGGDGRPPTTKRRRVDADGGDLYEDVDPEQPEQEKEAYERIHQSRADRAHTFLADQRTHPELALWISIASHVMPLHYKFFKAGRRASEKKQYRLELLMDMCQSKRSPAAKIVAQLKTMLMPEESPTDFKKHWRYMISLLGPVEQWPDDLRSKAYSWVCILIRGVHRRLVFFFMRWPWLLVAALDKRNTMEERVRVVDEFYDAKQCCTNDSEDGFSERFKEIVPKSEFWDAVVQAFLIAFFSRVALSTQFVECLFAAFEMWSKAARGKLTITNLSCKHVSHQFMLQHQVAFSDALVSGLDRSVRSSARGRPVWIQNKRVRQSKDAAASFRGNFIAQKAAADQASRHRHDKGQTLKDAHSAWHHAAGEDKQQIPGSQAGASTSSAAKELRLKAMLESYSNDAVSMGAKSSPWKIGDANAPLAVENMTRMAAAGLDQHSDAWTTRTASLIEGTGEHTASRVTASCCQFYSACTSTSSANLISFCDSFLADVRLVVAPWGTAAARRKHKPTPLIKLISECQQHTLFIQVANWRCNRGNSFEFDGFVLELVNAEAVGLPCDLKFGDPTVMLDTDIALRAGDLSVGLWAFYTCTATVDGAFRRVVRSIELIDVQAVRAEHEQAMAAKRALKLLADSKLPWSKRLKSTRVRRPHQFRRLRGPVGQRIAVEDDDADCGDDDGRKDDVLSKDSDGDGELVQEWKEAEAEQHDAAVDVAAPADAATLREDCRDERGYVFQSDVSAPLGRNAMQRAGATAQVTCWVHPQCSKWVTMKHVPDRNYLVRWVLAAQDEKYIPEPGSDTSAATLHMRDFYPFTKYRR